MFHYTKKILGYILQENIADNMLTRYANMQLTGCWTPAFKRLYEGGKV
jgi:hypothetical protein